MLKEEKEMRRWKPHIVVGARSLYLSDIRALVRAVREDCAKVAEGYIDNTRYGSLHEEC